MNIVALSGGYDSTLLLYKVVKEHIEPPLAVYFDIASVDPNKKRLEVKAIEALRNSGKLLFSFAKVIMHPDDTNSGVVSWSGGVPMQTIFAALAALYAPNGATVYFGYHRGDDFFHHSIGLELARRHICEAMGKEVQFSYPFEWVSKANILATIRKLDLEPFVWTCEFPTTGDGRCGKCLPCRNLAVADFAISVGGDFADTVLINEKSNDVVSEATKAVVEVSELKAPVMPLSVEAAKVFNKE